MLRNFYIVVTVLFLLFLFVRLIIKLYTNNQESDRKLKNTTELKIHDNLKQNLRNLEGNWTYFDNSQNFQYWVKICLDKNTLSGSYELFSKDGYHDENWAGNKKTEIKLIETGNIVVEEGYDKYERKAYEIVNKDEHVVPFKITDLSDSNWNLIMTMLEMEGKSMTKVSDDCK